MPPAPANLSAAATSPTSIALTWQDLAGPGYGYRIERGASAAGPWTLVAMLQTNAASYQDAGLAPGTTYFYRVATVDLAPESAPASAFASTPSGTTTPGALRWLKPYSVAGPGNQVHTLAVAVDKRDGACVTCGNFVGVVDFGNGPVQTAGGSRAFVAKHAANGALAWVLTWGNNFNTSLQAVRVARDGSIVATGYFAGVLQVGAASISSTPATFGGGYTNDVLVLKLGSSGSVQWARAYGGPGTDQGTALAIADDGAIYLAASTGDVATFGSFAVPFAGGTDIALAKLDGALGGVLWARSWGGTGYDIPHGLAIDRTGNVLMTGEVQGPVTIGGVTIPAVGQAELVLGAFSGVDGAPVWVVSASTRGRDAGYGVAVDMLTGNIALTGVLGSSYAFGSWPIAYPGLFLAVYNASGQIVWARGYSSSAQDVGYGVDVDSAGNITFAGQVGSLANFGGGTTSGPQSFFVAAYDRTGLYKWARRGAGNGQGAAKGVAYDGAGHVVTGGDCNGTTDFGGASISVPPGGVASFLAQYDA